MAAAAEVRIHKHELGRTRAELTQVSQKMITSDTRQKRPMVTHAHAPRQALPHIYPLPYVSLNAHNSYRHRVECHASEHVRRLDRTASLSWPDIYFHPSPRKTFTI